MCLVYDVIILPVANERLEKLDKFAKEKIIKRLSRLKVNPYIVSKHLSGYNLWSLKIGRSNYRAVFHIDEQKKNVTVVAIGKRENIYRNLQIVIRR